MKFVGAIKQCNYFNYLCVYFRNLMALALDMMGI